MQDRSSNVVKHLQSSESFFSFSTWGSFFYVTTFGLGCNPFLQLHQHPNICFTMERETDHVLPFLDVLINNTDPHQSVTTVYQKKTFTGLLTSYLSFCPFTYKLGLIKTLIHRTFKINNTWMGFHTDLQKLSVIRPPETFVFPISWFSSLFSKSGRRNIVR